MEFFVQCIVGTLAAIGLICILKIGYDIIFHRIIFKHGVAELYLYMPGETPEAEQFLWIAERIRKNYLPGLEVVLVDSSQDHEVTRFSAQEALAKEYVGMMRKGKR